MLSRVSETVGRLSVCPCVCVIIRQEQRRAAGLLLGAVRTRDHCNVVFFNSFSLHSPSSSNVNSYINSWLYFDMFIFFTFDLFYICIF